MNRARSVVTGLTRPFEKQTRHVPEFQIQLDDAYRQYGPGDVVSGHVLLSVVKPIDITHLVVCLHGFAQAYKTPNNPGEGYRAYNAALITGRTDRGGGYYGKGFISLFEDEAILCGEGRLPAQQYRFAFELEFPNDDNPSSVDVSPRPLFSLHRFNLSQFERGTITYMVTATLTRPNRSTIMNPVMTCETTVKYQEVVDVANIAQPRERTVELRGSQTRRSYNRRRLRASMPDGEPISSNASEAHSSQGSEHSTPSEQGASIITRISKGKAPSLLANLSPRTQGIKCTVSLVRGGYVLSDIIEVKVQIEHNRAVKSLHGVIVTFYRQGRIDTNPPLQIITGETQSRRLWRGPSWLPSTTGCHIFRKDLNQTFGSILINEGSLTQNIKAALRVPVDSFPTITSVPGAMISFKYFVEVIVDLPGKLTALDKFLPSPGHNIAHGLHGLETPGAHASRDWVSHCIDTEEIKREKKDVHVTHFEVMVGTIDSSRTLEAERERAERERAERAERERSERAEREAGREVNDDEAISTRLSRLSSPVPEQDAAEQSIPLPDDSHLSEKERMRLLEQRMLPSAPDGEPAESSTPFALPSAPFEADMMPNHYQPGHVNGHVFGPGAPAYEGPALAEGHDSDVSALPSAPTLEILNGPSTLRRQVEGVDDAEFTHDLPRYER
jgi:hypothetical protein